MSDKNTAENQEEIENKGDERLAIEKQAEELNTTPEKLQKALELGYDPSFEGDENKSAKTVEQFLELQPVYDDLRKKNRTIRELNEKVQALADSHKKIAEQTRKRTLDELKAQKKAAYEEGDTDKIIETDDKIRDLEREAQQEDTTEAPNPAMAEAYQNWIAKNPWYENDPDLKEVADALGAKMGQEDPSLLKDPDEFLSKITERVKKASPEKFKGTTRKAAVEADKGGPSSGTKNKHSLSSLDEETRRIAKRVIEATGMTEAEYLKQYHGDS